MTEIRYWKNLEYLLAIEPEHRLRVTLERGYSRVNVKYLQKALEKLPAEDPPKEKPVPKTSKEKDLIREKLLLEKNTLLAERAKLSNKFHSLDTVEARAANSKHILIIQNQIKKQNHRLNYYEENGELPDEKEAELFPLPGSALGIDRKIKSLRVMISQEKKKILKLAEEQDKKGIREAEKRLSRLQNYLSYAENALKEKEGAGS